MMRVVLLVILAMAALALGDNFLRARSGAFGVWQFMALRALFTVPLVLLLARLTGRPTRPRSFFWVALRSFLLALALALYFAALGVMTVPMVVAGFYTAPLFVLLFGRLFGFERIDALRAVAAVIGFAGVLIALRPGGEGGLMALLPVAGGMFYGLANLLARHRCAREGVEVLLAGFFIALALLGLAGLGLIAALDIGAPAGQAGFALRGWVPVSGEILLVTFVHGVVAIFAMILLTRAYLAAPTALVAPLEYAMLPLSALFGLLFGDPPPDAPALLGMAMIVAAGILVVRGGDRGGASG